MAHANARLNEYGRRLIITRVIDQGWPVAHAAKAMGISRQCAHRWLARWRTEGEAGLADRSSRPHHSPRRTSAADEARIIEARTTTRQGPDRLGPALGIAPRTVTRVLRRHQMPYLHHLDPITGEVIRATRTTTVRYEYDTPGGLVHTDVKKIGRIPEGGGWRLHGRQAGDTSARKKARIGYDYLHTLIDDHSRYAYTEALADETGTTTAEFLTRALDHFASLGIEVQRLISDNHWSYRRSQAVADALGDRHIKHLFIKPHCPWQNGKVERFNRTLAAEWAYSQPWTSNADRTAALAQWIHTYNTERNHSSLAGRPPISRLSPT